MANKGSIIPDIRFPIIIRTPDGTTTFYLNEKPLIKVYKSVFEKRIIHDSVIIDSNAIKYKVQSVENLGYINIFWGLNIFLGRNIHIKIVLQKIKELNLEDFKNFALKTIVANKNYYISAGKSINDLKEQIKQSTDNAEIMQVLI
jgi:hypothetical protein